MRKESKVEKILRIYVEDYLNSSTKTHNINFFKNEQKEILECLTYKELEKFDLDKYFSKKGWKYETHKNERMFVMNLISTLESDAFELENKYVPSNKPAPIEAFEYKCEFEPPKNYIWASQLHR